MAAPLILMAFLPLAEIALFIAVGQAVGFGPALLGLLAAAALGLWLLGRQAARVRHMALRAQTAGGPAPARAAVEGAGVFAAGVLLIVPGFLTDLLGLALLVPPLRAWMGRRLLRRIEGAAAGRMRWPRATRPSARPRGAASEPGLIEGEYRAADPPSGPAADPTARGRPSSPWRQG